MANRVFKALAVASGLLVPVAVATLFTARGADATGSAPVTVVNTRSNPVPVTGSVEVTNRPAQPFQASGDCVLADGEKFVSCDVFEIPDGKSAVIEYVSIGLSDYFAPLDTEYRPSLLTTLNGTEIRHRFEPYKQSNWYMEPGTGQLVRLYAGPGTTVRARITTNFDAPRTITFAISGTLSDVP